MSTLPDAVPALLSCWCRVHPVRAPSEAPPAPEEWARLTRVALREGVAGLLHRGLEADPLIRNVPRRTVRVLRRAALAQAAVCAREEAVLAEVLDALADRGIRPVLLRGLGLVARVYGEGSLRGQIDHDLLVDERDEESAARVIRSLGFRACPGHGGPFLRDASVVDLHTDPYDRQRVPSRGRILRADPVRVRNRSVSALVAGRSVAVLSPEDRLLALSAHVVKHSFDRLIRLVDVAECWRLGGFRAGSVVARAKEEGTADALFYALEASRVRLGLEVPHHVLEALRPPSRPWVERAFRRILSGGRNPHFAEWLLLAQLPDLRARLRAAAEMARPVELSQRGRGSGPLRGAGRAAVRLGRHARETAAAAAHVVFDRSNEAW